MKTNKVSFQADSLRKTYGYYMIYSSRQSGLILSIDFQQAFDSVSWKFIHKILDNFNFGTSFKRWIEIFQNGSESCILQNVILVLCC